MDAHPRHRPAVLAALAIAAGLLLALLLAGRAAAAAPPAPPGSVQQTATFSNTATNAVPDGTGQLTSTVTVSGAGTYLSDAQLVTKLFHTFPGDLKITLTSPAGTTIQLADRKGGGADDVFSATRWADTGADPVATASFTDGVAKPSLAGQQGFTKFLGENPNGTWTLTVADKSADDVGELRGWSLDVSTLDAPPALTTRLETSTDGYQTFFGTPVSSTVSVANAPIASAWKVRVHAKITSLSRGAMQVRLKSPSGREVLLVSERRPAGTGAQLPYLDTTFDDDATTLVTDVSSFQPATGFVNGVAPLGAFRGESVQGDWTLTVSDANASGGDGLEEWSLQIVSAGTPAVPTSATGCNPTTRSFTKTEAGSGLPVNTALREVQVGFGYELPSPDTVTWTESSLAVSGLGTGLHHVQVTTDVDAPAPGRLRLQLVAPNGRTVWLTRDHGSTLTSFFGASTWSGAVFDDAAGKVNSPGSVAEVFLPDDTTTGPVAPRQPLAALVGSNPNGTWRLRAFDSRRPERLSGLLFGGKATLKGFSLKLTTLDQAPVRRKSSVSAPPTSTAGSHLTRKLTLSGAGSVLDQLEVGLDAPNLPSDAYVFLTSPSGTQVTINPGPLNTAPSSLFSSLTLTDTAAESIASKLIEDPGADDPQALTSLSGPPVFSPLQAFGAFRGEDPNGEWTLDISASSGPIDLDDFTLTVRTATCTDRTAPTNPTLSSATHPPAAAAQGARITADLTGATDNVGVDGFSYAFVPTTAASTVDTTKDVGNVTSIQSPVLADGRYKLVLRTVDAAGNWSSPVVLDDLFVDTDPPDTRKDAGPADGAVIGDATPSFAYATVDLWAASPSRCQLDSLPVFDCPAFAYDSPTAWPDGPHTFRVFGQDTFQTDPTPATWTFTIDTAAPDTSITAGPSGPTSTSRPSWSFTSTEAGSTFTCQLDTGAAAACSSPYTPPADLTDGQHVLTVTASDAAGNADPTPATRTVTVDAATPETTITSAVAEGAVTSATTPSFTLTASEASTFECRLDGAAYATCTSPYTVGPLAPGAHSVAVRATDLAGNVDPTPATRGFTVDLTPPDTSFDSGPSGTIGTATPSFVLATTKPGSTFECQVDTGAYAACASPWTTPALSEGLHTLRVRARDAGDLLDPTPALRTVTVDLTGPDTTLGATPTGTTGTSPSFTFTSPEAGVTFECAVDNGAYVACISPRTLGALSHGAHRFDVRAVDAVGNADGSPAGRAFTVDAIAPDTSFTSGPAAGAVTNVASPSFALAADESPASFECKLDSGAFAPCTTPYLPGPLAAGSHTVAARATDGVGNVDPTPVSRTFTVDLTAPDTVIQTGPSGLVATATPTFTMTATKTGSTLECQLDSGAYVACTSPWTVPAVPALGDGLHTFRVRATDPAGNVDPTPALRTFTVDTTPPDTALGATPTGTTGPAPAFTFTSPDSGATFECSLDSGSYATCVPPRVYAGLLEGAHRVDVRAVDAAGNADPTPAGRAFTVDATPPDTSITQTSTDNAGGKATVTFTADEAGGSFECAVDSGAFAACTSPWTTPAQSDGTHTVKVRALDAVGNRDATPASTTFRIDRVVPNTTIDSGPSGTTTADTSSLTFSGDEAGVTFECDLDGAGTWDTCTSPSSVGPLADGSHTFRVRARDGAGNVDATPAARTWTIDTTAPQTSIDSGPSGTAGAAVSFAFSASEAGSTFTCSLDGAAASACTSPKAYAGLPAGDHTFAVTATDPLGNRDQTPATRTFTVDLTRPVASIVTGPAPDTAIATARPTFTLASSRPGSTFRCAFDSDPLVACSSPYQPPGDLEQGVRTLWVQAVDALGNVSAVLAQRTFRVDLIAPVTRIVTRPADVSTVASLAFVFGSSEDGFFECAVDGGAWVACDAAWSTGPLPNGVHRIGVRAVDAAGNRDLTPVFADVTVDVPAPAVAPLVPVVTVPVGGTGGTPTTATTPTTPSTPATPAVADRAVALVSPSSRRPTLRFVGTPLAVSRTAVQVWLRCPALTRPCRAAIALAPLGAAKARGLVLPSYGGRIRAGATTILRTLLPAASRAKLAGLRTVRVRLTVTLSSADGRAVTGRRTYTVPVTG